MAKRKGMGREELAKQIVAVRYQPKGGDRGLIICSQDKIQDSIPEGSKIISMDTSYEGIRKAKQELQQAIAA